MQCTQTYVNMDRIVVMIGILFFITIATSTLSLDLSNLHLCMSLVMAHWNIVRHYLKQTLDKITSYGGRL